MTAASVRDRGYHHLLGAGCRPCRHVSSAHSPLISVHRNSGPRDDQPIIADFLLKKIDLSILIYDREIYNCALRRSPSRPRKNSSNAASPPRFDQTDRWRSPPGESKIGYLFNLRLGLLWVLMERQASLREWRGAELAQQDLNSAKPDVYLPLVIGGTFERLSRRPFMNWIGTIAVMALAAVILSVVTDLEMTKCRSGSAYAMVYFCKLERPATTVPFECRYRGGCE